ncbi:MAG: winged helix DNA-binding domain-containing protein [Gemmatimonadales bacterium]
MKVSDIPRLRVASQLIAPPSSADPAAIVGRLGAVQAQDFLGSLWALGLRRRGAVEADIEAAIAAGSIVRSWPLRGTLHFVAADDLRWMLALLAPRMINRSAGRHRQLGLDAAVFARCRKVFARVLRDGQPRSRPTLYAALAAAGIASDESRGLHILGQLAHEGMICFGPRAGRQPTFVLLDAWIPPTPTRPRDEALGELAVRYFATRGPATVADFAWWSGLPVRDARAALELAGDRLRAETIDGQPYWRGGDAGRPSRSAAVHLLPAFDEYTVAYRDRTAVLDPAHARAVNQGGGMLNPVVVADGRVVGTWARSLGAQAVTVAVRPFGRLSRATTDAVEAAAERYRRFLGLERVHCEVPAGR